jgi:hypothetical protein
MNFTTPVENLRTERLRSEAKFFGIKTIGMSRSDLIIELKSKGLYDVDLRFPAKPPRIDTSNRKDDLSNVFIGNGSGKYEQCSNKLYIANSDTEYPLIKGDFKEEYIQIHHVLNVKEKPFDASLQGNEGDIRREGPYLYMYRSSDGFTPGWYPLQFGSLKIF